MSEPVIAVEDLHRHYTTHDGWIERLTGRGTTIRAVDGVTLAIQPGETVGLVGESGCGKTTLGQTMVRLLEPTAGTVRVEGEDVTTAQGDRLRALRSTVQYVFQDAGASLDPRQTVSAIVGEPLDIHRSLDREARTARVAELLEQVDLQPIHGGRYPHELSGGQRQRVAIARALAVEPSFIVLDEPVTGLDVSVQSRILALLDRLQERLDVAYLLIAHDLAVAEQVCDRVTVMYLGELVERGAVEAVFGDPSHPYTEALRSAIPVPDPRWDGDRIVLEGSVPDAADPPTGCRFHPRCHRLITPSGYDLDRDTTRAIHRLLERIEAGAESIDRDALDLPDPLPDSAAERVVSDAIEHVAADNLDGAKETLAALTSPCRRTRPALEAGSSRHPIACLHYRETDRQ